MIISSIDVGTNTVLLLIAEVDTHGTIHPLEHQQRFPRLGRKVDSGLVIDIPAFDRVAWILKEYQNLSKQFHAVKIIAGATSAVRDATNKDEFLSYIHKETGIDVELISGEEEALLTYKGAVSGFHSSSVFAVLDIGGGSTEFSYPEPGSHNGGTKLNRYSLQIGAVRLTERFFKHNPPHPAEIESAKELIIEELAQIRNPGFHETTLVGVAGSVTTLACLEQNLREFQVDKVSGFTLSTERIAFWNSRLQSMNADEIRSLSSATEGRSDILTAGVLILGEVMKHFRFPGILVSERGLRYGMTLREWERSRRIS